MQSRNHKPQLLNEDFSIQNPIEQLSLLTLSKKKLSLLTIRTPFMNMKSEIMNGKYFLVLTLLYLQNLVICIDEL